MVGMILGYVMTNYFRWLIYAWLLWWARRWRAFRTPSHQTLSVEGTDSTWTLTRTHTRTWVSRRSMTLDNKNKNIGRLSGWLYYAHHMTLSNPIGPCKDVSTYLINISHIRQLDIRYLSDLSEYRLKWDELLRERLKDISKAHLHLIG